jgi:hypothetical protein
MAETKADADAAFDAFIESYQVKGPDDFARFGDRIVTGGAPAAFAWFAAFRR